MIKEVISKVTNPAHIISCAIIVVGIFAIAEVTGNTGAVMAPVATVKSKLGKKTA